MAPRRSERVAAQSKHRANQTAKITKNRAKTPAPQGKRRANQAASATKNRTKESAVVPTPPAKPPPPILELPSEIWEQIIGFVDAGTPEHVRSLRQTCKRVAELCEPAFCKRLDTANGNHERILTPRPERHNFVKSFIAHTVPGWDRFGVEGVVTCIPKFPKLEVLHICDIRCCRRLSLCLEAPEGPFLTTINNMLSCSAFTELRECTVCPLNHYPIWIAPVLKAPKLTTLTVSYPILDYLDDTLPPPNSLPLKHLTLLIDPRMNRQAVHSILSMPKALETLAFDDGRASGLQPEQGLLAEVLPTLARHQPKLKTLKVYAITKSVLSDTRFTGRFDFAQLTGLKELGFVNHGRNPINCFFKLPTGLERLRLSSSCNEISILDLAKALSELPHRPSFTSSLHIDMFWDYTAWESYGDVPRLLAVPFSGYAEQILENHRQGMILFMSNFPCKQLTLAERSVGIQRQLQATWTNPDLGTQHGRECVLHEAMQMIPFQKPDPVDNPERNDLAVFDGCCFQRGCSRH